MEESNDLFKLILSRGPSQGTLFLVLTKMKEEGRFSEVIEESREALRLYPDDTRLRRLLAECYLEAGSTSLAEKELEKVISDIEDLIPAFKLQAEIYSRQDRFEKGSEMLELYLAHNPDDQEALELLTRLKPVEEEPLPEPPVIIEDAAPALEEELEKEAKEETITEVPEAPAEVVLVAEEKFEEETLPEAVEAPDKPVTDLATPTLAEIYYNQGQINQAINTYEMVLLENPDDHASRDRLAELKGSIAEDTLTPVPEEDELKARTKKMITILEGWLERIQEVSHA